MPDAAPPLNRGRYRLIEVLGEGGMAAVYRAYDDRLDVDRAIKVLNSDLARRASIRKRFENEARTMARLHHKNMVMVHDVDEDGDRVYIVMELLEGGSVIDYMKEVGPLHPRLACDVTMAILEALEMAHNKGVIHRDIKPHNILLHTDGTPKITDFGIAQVSDGDKSLTRTGAVMGTWAYMAPEQRVSAKSVDARSDVYAVGATLYAMLKNEEPFDIYTTELHDELFANVPPPFDDIIKKATRYRQNDRYSSAAEMLEALKEVLPQLPEVPEDVPALGSVVSDDVPDSTIAMPIPQADDQPQAARSVTAADAPSETYAMGGLAEVPQDNSQPTFFPEEDVVADDVDETVTKKPPHFTLSDANTTFPDEPEPSRGRRAAYVVVPILLVVLLIGSLGVAGAMGAGAALWMGSGTEVATADPQPAPAPAPVPVAPAPAPKETKGKKAKTEPTPKPAEPKPKSKSKSKRITAPAPTPAPAPAPTVVVRPKPQPTGLGSIFVNSRPYSEVIIDGHSYGDTIYRNKKFPAGTHKLELRSKKGTHKTSITVPKDGHIPYCWDFNLGKICPR